MRELRDYCYQLLEYLRYALQNLDPTNFNEQEMDAWITKPIMAQITDVNGNIAQLVLTADSLTSQLKNAEGDISTLQQTATSLTSRVGNAEGNITTLTQTANGLTTRVANAEGNITTVQQTANGLQTSVTNIDKAVGTIKSTMLRVDSNGLIVDTNGKTTEISGNIIKTGTVTADKLQSGIFEAILQSGNISAFDLYNSDKNLKGSFFLSGSNDDIHLASYDGSNMYITSNGDMQLDANTIDIDAGNEGTKIWVSSKRYWTFSSGGIYYCDSNGTVLSHASIVSN